MGSMMCPACAKAVLGECALCAACRAAYHAGCWKAVGCAACGCAKEPVVATIGRPARMNAALVALTAATFAVLAGTAVAALLGARFWFSLTPEQQRPATQPPSEAARAVPPAETRRAFQLFEDPQPAYEEVEGHLVGIATRPARPPTTVFVESIARIEGGVVRLPARELSSQRTYCMDALLPAPGLALGQYELAVGAVRHAGGARPLIVRVLQSVEDRAGADPAGGTWHHAATLALARTGRQTARFWLARPARALRFVLHGSGDVTLEKLTPVPNDAPPPAPSPVAAAFDPLLGVGAELLSDGTMLLFSRLDGTCALADVARRADGDAAGFRAALQWSLGAGPVWARAFTGIDVPAEQAPWRAGLSHEAGQARLTEFLRSFALPRLRIAARQCGPSVTETVGPRFIDKVRIEKR